MTGDPEPTAPKLEPVSADAKRRRFTGFAAVFLGVLICVLRFFGWASTLSVALGGLSAAGNLWISSILLRQLVGPHGNVSQILGVLLFKLLGLLLLASLMVTVRAAQPFSLALSFVSVTIVAVCLVGLPQRSSATPPR